MSRSEQSVRSADAISRTSSPDLDARTPLIAQSSETTQPRSIEQMVPEQNATTISNNFLKEVNTSCVCMGIGCVLCAVSIASGVACLTGSDPMWFELESAASALGALTSAVSSYAFGVEERRNNPQ